MRTTVRFNDELLRAARRRAADEGTTLTAVLERALRAYLGGPAPRGRYRLRWRTEAGRPLPGVRVEDRDSLFDLLDGRP
jgi:hypothetical protein